MGEQLPTKHFQLANQAVFNARITLETGVPVSTTDQTGKTTLYLTPFRGDKVSLYDGSVWAVHTLSEISITTSGLSTDTVYDVFLYDSSGTLTLELAAWNSSTQRHASGTYASDLPTQDNIFVKSTNGTTIDATKRYVGTIRTDGSTQFEDSTSRRLVYNYYNRVLRRLTCGDATNTWNYTDSWRAANGSEVTGTGRVDLVLGVDEDIVQAIVHSLAVNSSGGQWIASGVGIDSTSTNHAQLVGQVGYPNVRSVPAYYKGHVGIGYHFVQRLEHSQTPGTTTWYGDGGQGSTQTGMMVEIMS